MYDTHFSPVIVTGWTDATRVGLFLLAESRDGTTLCHVGAQQAEYHVWLATDARFVEAALTHWPARSRVGSSSFFSRLQA